MNFRTYNIDIQEIIQKIKKHKATRVLLQFPDGLKPYALDITKQLEQAFPKKIFFIWLGTCFGSCDIPPITEKHADMIIQFGHFPWPYKNKNFKIVK